MPIVKVYFNSSCWGDYDKSTLIIELKLTDQSAKKIAETVGKEPERGCKR